MSKWKLFTIASLVLMSMVDRPQGQVTLRVLLQPPFITLECLIINPTVKASVIMMCPMNRMCFQNCSRICSDDCTDNNITCTAKKINVGMSYAYRFSTNNIRNQGEWRCHFGEQESSSVILFNTTAPNAPIPVTLEASTQAKTTSLSVIPRFDYHASTSSDLKRTKDRPLINEPNVIGLLILFVISLCLNILLVTRCIVLKCSSRKNSVSHQKTSCLLEMCLKLCCVGRGFKMKKFRNDTLLNEKHMLPRQVSNNVYESTGHSLIQPAILLDNYAFIGSPTNQRLFSTNIYTRSQSFPAKSVDSQQNGFIIPNKVYTTPMIRQTFAQHIPSQESVNQIIYDDVPDQSIGYAPHNYFSHINKYNRPSQFISMNGNLNGRLPQTAMSMNNLATNGFRMSETGIYGDDSTEETVLKDAINSRVELSKEMINQADCLLRRADNLLGDKETTTGTSAT